MQEEIKKKLYQFKITKSYDEYREYAVFDKNIKIGTADADACELFTLNIDEKYRKKGIGKEFYNFIEKDQIQSNGCSEIFGKSVSNDSNVFWKSLGFKIGKYDGNYYPITKKL